MSTQRATPVNELLAKIIFLIIPSIAVCYFLLWNTNQYFSVIGDPHFGLFKYLPAAINQSILYTCYIGAGMLLGAAFYAFRFRFLVTFPVLVISLYLIYKGLDKYEVGWEDAFFVSIQFKVFATLFIAGWLTGWGFTRLRYWSVFMAAALLCSCVLLITKSKTDSVYSLLGAFAPAVLYAVYIVFTAEQIYNYKDKSQKFWWFMSRRLILFGILAIALLGGVIYEMKDEIKDTVANFGGGGKKGDGLLKKNKNGTSDMSPEMQMRGNFGRGNDLMFCAHIDNYFPNTDYPNPLYLTTFYYTKFDASTETFEKDQILPDNDLFQPNPSKLPLFFTKYDSSVIRSGLHDRHKKTVEVDIYCKNLAPNVYLSPSVGFFVQPIAIEKDFRNEFKTAYRTKSYVSELNSAYFIYNINKPEVRKFQQIRFDTLRNVKNYAGVDAAFMKYYTQMPPDVKYKPILDLAQKITQNAKTPVDKVLAIRDYFLSKDENGDPLYYYTDNPGVPDLPSASKLMYFLTENHKGYCAYYAGATLFMLRSMGIPSRIAVGFLTEDRSDKNKGWYWYYANQAHAWVQVYFPGLGWIDFDTTVSNTEAHESPKPDGTPPLQPPKAWLAADGIVENVDTLKKQVIMKVKHMIFHDKEYDFTPVDIHMDLKVATILLDSLEVPLKTIQNGDEATAVSYAEAFKKMEAAPGEKGNSIVKRFPSLAPIDEVYLKRKDTQKPEPKEQAAKQEKPVSYKALLITAACVLAGIILFILLLPTLIFWYYLLRNQSSKSGGNKVYWTYRAAMFYLNQVGVFRGTKTPMSYAREIVDPSLGTSFTRFMNIYLKRKYANQPLSRQEQDHVSHFLKPFIATVRQKTPFKNRLAGFLNPIRSVSFFVTPEDEKDM